MSYFHGHYILWKVRQGGFSQLTFCYCRLWLLGMCAYKFWKNKIYNLSCLLSACAYLLKDIHHYCICKPEYKSMDTSNWDIFPP